jgi:hypothetical protein
VADEAALSFVIVSGEEVSVLVCGVDVEIGALEATPSLEIVIMLRLANRRVPAHSPQ